jgi:micrococcal nuclease
MKKTALFLLIISFMISLYGLLPGCAVKEPAGRSHSENGYRVLVTRVIDGDTFEIIDRGKKDRVRMIGIDTPESVKPDAAVEPYGREASCYTKKLIQGKMVRLEFDVEKRDRYGRLLAYVYLEDGTLVNAKLLEEGLAAIITVPPNVSMADTFVDIQRKAREEKKGIWKR